MPFAATTESALLPYPSSIYNCSISHPRELDCRCQSLPFSSAVSTHVPVLWVMLELQFVCPLDAILL